MRGRSSAKRMKNYVPADNFPNLVFDPFRKVCSQCCPPGGQTVVVISPVSNLAVISTYDRDSISLVIADSLIRELATERSNSRSRIPGTSSPPSYSPPPPVAQSLCVHTLVAGDDHG
jgi:hypothetical protein